MPSTVRSIRLSVDDAVDLRDVGGLACRNGGSTRHLVLLRGGTLRPLGRGDARVLLAVCGIGLVADLRSADELAADGPSVLARAGVATVHLPLVDDVGATLPGAAADPTAALRRTYRAYLEERGHHLVTLARLVAGARTATLVHGAAGRDRTGVAVGMLLDAVGVERSAVVADHTATGDDRARTLAAEVDPAAHVARPAVLTELLERVDDEHGGAAEWLRRRGLTAAELDALRHRLVRPAPHPQS